MPKIRSSILSHQRLHQRVRFQTVLEQSHSAFHSFNLIANQQQKIYQNKPVFQEASRGLLNHGTRPANARPILHTSPLGRPAVDRLQSRGRTIYNHLEWQVSTPPTTSRSIHRAPSYRKSERHPLKLGQGRSLKLETEKPVRRDSDRLQSFPGLGVDRFRAHRRFMARARDTQPSSDIKRLKFEDDIPELCSESTSQKASLAWFTESSRPKSGGVKIEDHPTRVSEVERCELEPSMSSLTCSSARDDMFASRDYAVDFCNLLTQELDCLQQADQLFDMYINAGECQEV
ncbi:hypothetical protein B0H34DRAFT_684624 [Crassisporium funariophilum]|nr:hypothetical protein B0H34DRAFT_684624 [Crassisporium funariophilum]